MVVRFWYWLVGDSEKNVVCQHSGIVLQIFLKSAEDGPKQRALGGLNVYSVCRNSLFVAGCHILSNTLQYAAIFNA